MLVRVQCGSFQLGDRFKSSVDLFQLPSDLYKYIYIYFFLTYLGND